MLCFYLRIFPNRWFKISCWVTMAACFCYGVAFLLVSVFQCRPLSYAWHHWDGEHSGTCNNINAQGWTSAAFNVILDVIVIALPLPLLAKLQLNKRKKFLVILMFSVGFVVTIISILRLQVLVQFGNTTNFTCMYLIEGLPLEDHDLLTRSRSLQVCRVLVYSRARSRCDMRLYARHQTAHQVGNAQTGRRHHTCGHTSALQFWRLWDRPKRFIVREEVSRLATFAGPHEIRSRRQRLHSSGERQ